MNRAFDLDENGHEKLRAPHYTVCSIYRCSDHPVLVSDEDGTGLPLIQLGHPTENIQSHL